MQLKPITAIAVLLLVVASLLVAGCTKSPTSSSPTATPTSVDYSSQLTKDFESTNAIMTRPFTKSVNSRGNDVYKGIGKNATLADAGSTTVVVEFTKSETQAKTVYDGEVATKQNDGYVYSAEGVAYRKATLCTQCTNVWAGIKGNNIATCDTQYAPQYNAWVVTTQTA